MKVLYDYQIFDEQRIGGISRYHADLYKGCINNQIEAEVALLYSNNIYIKSLIKEIKPQFSSEDKFLPNIKLPYKHYLYKVFKKIFGPYKNSTLLNKEYCNNVIAQHDFDIFHPTYYHEIYTQKQISTPIVITIHDMIYESHPHYFNNIDIISKKEAMIHNATSIIAISNYTKEQILRFYPHINENKIKVIYHGIKLETPQKPSTETKENFILFVGGRDGYKNFYRLLRAFSKIKNSNTKLICVGKDFSHDECVYIKFLNLQTQVINKGRISDEELQSLYIKAKVYISPSLIEGFGLPLLEAMKFYTPLLISDIPIYREIIGNNAIYFDPLDEDDIAEKIDYALDHESAVEELTVQAIKRLQYFSQDKTIKNTLSLYTSLI